MLHWQRLRSPEFLIGLICGAAAIGGVWIASTWRGGTTRQYDECLVAQRGNVAACDSIMRMRDAYERLKR